MKRDFLGVCSLVIVAAGTWLAMSNLFPPQAAEKPNEVPTAAASETASGESSVQVMSSASEGEYGLLAIGVGLTMLGGALGTGLAQKSIGTAVVAACAENRSFLGIGVFLLALPETILIIATGIAYLLLQHIKV